MFVVLWLLDAFASEGVSPVTTAEVWACVALLQADPRWQNAQLDPLTLASEDKRVVFRDARSGRVHEFRDAQDLREWVERMTKGGGQEA